MILLVFILSLSLSELVILSPDDLRNTPYTTEVFAFGNPSLLARVGVLKIPELGKNCDFKDLYNEFDFLVIPTTTECDEVEIIQNAVSRNASMIIFLKNDKDLTKVDFSVKNLEYVNATVIRVSKSLEQSIKSVTKYLIWAKYQYSTNILPNIHISYYFTHNYTLDKIFIEQILNLDRDSISFSPYFSYINITNKTEQDDNCYIHNNKAYCLEPGNNGTMVIENGFYISRLYQKINNPWVFLETMLDIYNNCEFDYSLGCLKEKEKVEDNIDANLLIWANQSSIFPYYDINEALIYWPNYLKETYCLSGEKVPRDCKPCGMGCYYNYLALGIKMCSLCNSSSCGYINLDCFKEESVIGGECYTFMLSDGSCNEGCKNDPDCSRIKSSEISKTITNYIVLPCGFYFIV